MTRTESALGLFLLKVYDSQSPGKKMPQGGPILSLNSVISEVQFPLASEHWLFPWAICLGSTPPSSGNIELGPQDLLCQEIEELIGPEAQILLRSKHILKIFVVLCT